MTQTKPSPEPIDFATKLAFGAGDTCAAIASILLLSYLSPFLTDVAKLSPSVAGWSQLIGKIWDAVNEPIVGIMSDRGQIFSDRIYQKWGLRFPIPSPRSRLYDVL